MNVWWISLLSFLAGFVICTAIAGWLVAWQLWRRPSLQANRLKLALYDPELAEPELPDVQIHSTTSSPPSLEVDRTAGPSIETLPREASPAGEHLVQHVFERNLAMRARLRGSAR